MTAIIELHDLPTDADSGGGGGDLRKFKDVKEKTARGKSAPTTEGDTEHAFRKSESVPGAQQSPRADPEGDDGRASKYKKSNSYHDGGATLGREGPQMSLCQVYTT